MPFLFVPVQYLEHQGSDPLLEVSGGHQPCPRYTPALLACIARKARCLAAFAVARGWAATAEVRGAAAAGRYPRLTGCRCHLKLQLPSTFYKCNSSPHLPTLQLLLPAVSADGANCSNHFFHSDTALGKCGDKAIFNKSAHVRHALLLFQGKISICLPSQGMRNDYFN